MAFIEGHDIKTGSKYWITNGPRTEVREVEILRVDVQDLGTETLHTAITLDGHKFFSGWDSKSDAILECLQFWEKKDELMLEQIREIRRVCSDLGQQLEDENVAAINAISIEERKRLAEHVLYLCGHGSPEPCDE